MAKVNFPKPEELQDLLTKLMEAEVVVEKGRNSFNLESSELFAMAFYFSRDGFLRAVALSDIHFVVNAASIFTMMPAGRAEKEITSGEVEDELFEAYMEVMNVLANPINEISSEPIVLRQAFRVKKDKVPNKILGFFNHSQSESYYSAKIEGYGDGKFSLFGY